MRLAMIQVSKQTVSLKLHETKDVCQMSDQEDKIIAVCERIKEIRDLNNQENELINNRFTWMAVVEGLIINAYIGLIVECMKSNTMSMVCLAALIVLCILGVLISLSFHSAFCAAQDSLTKLKMRYRKLIDKLKSISKDIDAYPIAIGLYSDDGDMEKLGDNDYLKKRRLDPWNMLPIIFIFVWGILLVLAVFQYYGTPRS